jgi:hypothetical protein
MPPRRGGFDGGAGRLAFSIPLGLPGLMSGRPLRPFSRAISSRCSMTVRLRSATRSISFTTRVFNSAFGSDSMSAGGDIPKANPKSRRLGSRPQLSDSICRSHTDKP